MSKPVIALVGRPNVGKSSIFNALAGSRISIVHDSPGVTRDRIYAEPEWFGREFILIDTGGLEPGSLDPIHQQMARQVGFALEAADVILFLCDLKEGLTHQDREIASYLRKSDKPIILALNKADQVGAMPPEAYEFYELGLGEPYCVSAVHRLGLGEMVSALLAEAPEAQATEEEDQRISVAIIGKPNVGKSSLLNNLLAEDRAIVSDIPGTTRDSLDVNIDNAYGSFRFIDTAGLRRKSKVKEAIEKYSILRTQAAVERADVCLILLDATDEISEQDTKIAGLAHNAGKASLFVVNKWDLLEGRDQKFQAWQDQIKLRFAFMPYAEMTAISAVTGQRVEGLYQAIVEIYEENSKRLSTAVVNEVLAEALSMHRPPSDKGRALKIYYGSQVSTQPPHFIFFINDKKLLHFSYERYLENRLREAFGFRGSPIFLSWRERKRDDYLKIDRKTPARSQESQEY
ncbi:MAG: ribosome biogenesis GTPase Der [Eubacteriales bacterium]|nr:ribosome biogenesis GTPase Der [Eubacteriales bacterium]